MRHSAFFLLMTLSTALWAQTEVRITNAATLGDAPDTRKVKGIQEALQAAGFPKEEIQTILAYGDRDQWPEGIRSDTARASNAPYIINYEGFRLCTLAPDTAPLAVVMIPAAYNTHMPDGMRPLGDFYMVLPERALTNAERPKPRPAVSRGPRWEGRPKAKIIKADGLYGAYDLATDTTGLKALEARGWSRPEIDAVIFRSTERNWPEGIDNFEQRYPKLAKFPKYRAYLGAEWDDKVLLIIPTAKNRRMPVTMRPYMDLYFVYGKDAVKVGHRR